MGRILSTLILVYLIGICVELAPTVSSLWNKAPASELTASIADQLPTAAAWPEHVYNRLTQNDGCKTATCA